jgi:hypothetical protein
MKRRVTYWAIGGLVVGCAWVAFAFATVPDVEVKFSLVDRAIRILAYLTCPIIAAGLPFYWVLPANAVTYALAGFVLESIRKKRNAKKKANFRTSYERNSTDSR